MKAGNSAIKTSSIHLLVSPSARLRQDGGAVLHQVGAEAMPKAGTRAAQVVLQGLLCRYALLLPAAHGSRNGPRPMAPSRAVAVWGLGCGGRSAKKSCPSRGPLDTPIGAPEGSLRRSF